ncbi:MAG: hypothetical protein H7A37_01295 [Chlamydiales bacterium]|nr:hypothetical protein [Chlamydiales bacterium]
MNVNYQKPVLSDEKPANEEEENTPKVEEQRLTREDAAIERMRVKEMNYLIP